MDYILPVSQLRLRENLSEMVENIVVLGRRRLVITRYSCPEAVIVFPEEMEILEAMADKDLLSAIVRAEKRLQQGELFSHNEVFDVL